MRKQWTLRLLAAALVAGAMLVAQPTRAFSAAATGTDKITLKDGKVVEGTITKELDGYIWMTVMQNGVEQKMFYSPAEVTKIERDADAAPKVEDPAKKTETDPASPSPRKSGVPRIAILTLEEEVGIQFAAKPLEDAIPDLEKEGVTDVILKVKSGGGLAIEVQKLSDVIQLKYKPRFRTVGWIESAISAAAMSTYCLEEIYFMPRGNMGACTAWHGALEAAKGRGLEGYLQMMEKISARANRDPKIMRAMQISSDPADLGNLQIAGPAGQLSATIDDNGEVHWYQDLTGQYILNPKGDLKILTFNSEDAAKFKFSKGTAATKEELAKLMGYNEVEWVGKEKPGYRWPICRAEERLIAWREDTTDAQNRFNQHMTKYQVAVQNASGSSDKQGRASFVNKARQALDTLKQITRNHPNFKLLFGLTDEWFEEQEELLRKLMR